MGTRLGAQKGGRARLHGAQSGQAAITTLSACVSAGLRERLISLEDLVELEPVGRHDVGPLDSRENPVNSWTSAILRRSP